jgi:hypothetical protein
MNINIVIIYFVSFLCLGLALTFQAVCKSSSSSHASLPSRRSFVVEIAAAAPVAAAIAGTTSLLQPESAVAAAGDDNTPNIKVTPLAHTFVSNGGSRPKPIRENDTTRLLTNARVVYLLEGKGSKTPDLAMEVLQLTIQRKADRGPGESTADIVQQFPCGRTASQTITFSLVDTNPIRCYTR